MRDARSVCYWPNTQLIPTLESIFPSGLVTLAADDSEMIFLNRIGGSISDRAHHSWIHGSSC